MSETAMKQFVPTMGQGQQSSDLMKLVQMFGMG
jgi:hypothetical protein